MTFLRRAFSTVVKSAVDVATEEVRQARRTLDELRERRSDLQQEMDTVNLRIAHLELTIKEKMRIVAPGLTNSSAPPPRVK